MAQFFQGQGMPATLTRPDQPLAAKRRKAVSRVMKRLVPQDQLLAVMGLWQRDYEPQGDPYISEYVGRIKHRFHRAGLEEPAIRVLCQVFHALGAAPPSGALSSDAADRADAVTWPRELKSVAPTPQEHVTREDVFELLGDAFGRRPSRRRDRKHDSTAPMLQVFQILARMVFNEMERLHPGASIKACTWLRRELEPGRAKTPAGAEERYWLENAGRTPMSGDLTAGQLRRLMRGICQWGMIHLHREDISRIFTLAIAEAQRLPEAQQFDPRHLVP